MFVPALRKLVVDVVCAIRHVVAFFIAILSLRAHWALIIPTTVPDSPPVVSSPPNSPISFIFLDKAMLLSLKTDAFVVSSPTANCPVASLNLPTLGQHLEHDAQQEFYHTHPKRESPLTILVYWRPAPQCVDAGDFVRIQSVRTAVDHDVGNPKRTDEETWRAFWAHPRCVVVFNALGPSGDATCSTCVVYKRLINRLVYSV